MSTEKTKPSHPEVAKGRLEIEGPLRGCPLGRMHSGAACRLGPGSTGQEGLGMPRGAGWSRGERGAGARRGGAAAGGAAPVASAHFRESLAPWPPPARSCQLAGAVEPVSVQARPQPRVCAARAAVRHHGGVGAAAARRDHGGPGLRQGHRVVAHHQTLRAEAPLQRGPAPPEHAAGHRWELRPRAGNVRSSRRGFAGRGRGSCSAPRSRPGKAETSVGSFA